MKYFKVVVVSILFCGSLMFATQVACADNDGNDSELRGGKITFYKEEPIPSTSDSSSRPTPKTDGNSLSNEIKKKLPTTGEKQSQKMEVVGSSLLLVVLSGLLTSFYKKGEYM